MAVDLDKVRAAKQAAEAKQAAMSSARGSMKIFKFEGTEAKLRFMPPWAEEGVFAGQFWREVAQHWGISEDQKGPVLCPQKTPFMEGECPICEFVDELRNQKNNPEALELAKDIRAKTAYLFTVIDRKNPEYTAKDVAEWKQARPDKEVPFGVGDPKFQMYAAPFTVYNAILNIFANGGDIVDLESGHDVIITRSGTGITTKYTVTAEFKETPAGVPEDVQLLDLGAAGFTVSYEEMQKLLDDGIGGDFAASLPSGAAKAVASLSVDASREVEEEEDDLEAAMRKGL